MKPPFTKKELHVMYTEASAAVYTPTYTYKQWLELQLGSRLRDVIELKYILKKMLDVKELTENDQKIIDYHFKT